MSDTKTQIQKNESSEVEIDLFELLGEIKNNIIYVIIAAVVFAVGAFIYTRFLIKPVYTARSSIYVVSASANSALDLSDLNFGTSLTKDYAKLVTSRTMLENVLDETGDALSPSQLRGMVSIGNDTGTRILEFSVTSRDPVQAMRLANSFSKQALIFLPDVMGIKDNPPTIIDPAILPTSPSNIATRRNVVIGFILGVVRAAAVIIIRYLRKDTFATPDDIEKYLGIVPLAVVPENGMKHRGSGYYYYYTNAHGKGGE